MDIEELKSEMIALTGMETEMLHITLDALLIKYIGDEEVAEIFRNLPRWYS